MMRSPPPFRCRRSSTRALNGEGQPDTLLFVCDVAGRAPVHPLPSHPCCSSTAALPAAALALTTPLHALRLVENVREQQGQGEEEKGVVVLVQGEDEGVDRGRHDLQRQNPPPGPDRLAHHSVAHRDPPPAPRWPHPPRRCPVLSIASSTATRSQRRHQGHRIVDLLQYHRLQEGEDKGKGGNT
jgi:hypothetical protein